MFGLHLEPFGYHEGTDICDTAKNKSIVAPADANMCSENNLLYSLYSGICLNDHSSGLC